MAEQDIYFEDVPGLNGYGACPDSCEAAPGPGLGVAVAAVVPAAIALGEWIRTNYGTQIIGAFGGGRECAEKAPEGQLPRLMTPAPPERQTPDFQWIMDTLTPDAAKGNAGPVRRIVPHPELAWWSGADWMFPATTVALLDWETRWVEATDASGRALAALQTPYAKGWACRSPGDASARTVDNNLYVRIKNARPGEQITVTDGTVVAWQGTVPGGAPGGFGTSGSGAPSGGGFGLGGLLGGGVATVGLIGLAAWLLLKGKK